MSLKAVMCALTLLCVPMIGQAQQLTIAAASSLKFALADVVSAFKQASPNADITLVFGSSGKFNAQVQQGAPFDLYFSADIAYLHALAEKGYAASEVMPYALGRIVLWSTRIDVSKMTLADLAQPQFRRIAIANPRHAPYGQRAVEALQAASVWPQVQPKMVYGESIAHATHFVQTGNAQAGIISLSLVLSPELANQGKYVLIPEHLHAPIEQGFMITKRAANNDLAKRFADYMSHPEARRIMTQYGFTLPAKALSTDMVR